MKQPLASEPGDGHDAGPGGDPWAAFGYLVAGVAVYGAVGWGLSVWLNAEYWIPIGILFGAALGLYMVLARYLVRPGSTRDSETSSTHGGTATEERELIGDVPPDEHHDDRDMPDAARFTRPASDDRGETA